MIMFFNIKKPLFERYFDLSKDGGVDCRNSINENFIVEASTPQPLEESTFLSHRSEDMADVKKIYNFIHYTYNESIYIDKEDAKLPSRTNKRTALRLKEQIERCNKFVLVVTQHSKESSWIPWEIGYADGVKDIKDIAIFPCNNSLVDKTDNNTWAGQEYLGLYPRIVFDSNDNVLWVVSSENCNMTLENWFNS